MGMFNPGLLMDFDCDNFSGIILNSANPTTTLAQVTLDVMNPNSTAWLTAYATWVPSASNVTLTLTIVREGTPDVEICSATDTPAEANSGFTTAMTCCDENPPTGEVTYTLIASGTGLTGGQTITINEGTFTGALINADTTP